MKHETLKGIFENKNLSKLNSLFLSLDNRVFFFKGGEIKIRDHFPLSVQIKIF